MQLLLGYSKDGARTLPQSPAVKNAFCDFKYHAHRKEFMVYCRSRKLVRGDSIAAANEHSQEGASLRVSPYGPHLRRILVPGPHLWDLYECAGVQLRQECGLIMAAQGRAGIAFCCISTGVFHFPSREAAEIAVHTVRGFLRQKTSTEKVIFNVFQDRGHHIYQELLNGN